MLRFRGKRLWYLVFAAFATFLIFSWSRESEGIPEFDIPVHVKDGGDVSNGYRKPGEEALPEAHKVDEVKKKTTSVPIVEIKATPAPTPSPAPKKVVLETPVKEVKESTLGSGNSGSTNQKDDTSFDNC